MALGSLYCCEWCTLWSKMAPELWVRQHQFTLDSTVQLSVHLTPSAPLVLTFNLRRALFFFMSELALFTKAPHTCASVVKCHVT